LGKNVVGSVPGFSSIFILGVPGSRARLWALPSPAPPFKNKQYYYVNIKSRSFANLKGGDCLKADNILWKVHYFWLPYHGVTKASTFICFYEITHYFFKNPHWNFPHAVFTACISFIINQFLQRLRDN
jgi:hypothetical protein